MKSDSVRGHDRFAFLVNVDRKSAAQFDEFVGACGEGDYTFPMYADILGRKIRTSNP